jgi:hypothetical protein
VTVTASRNPCPGAGGDPLAFRQSAPNNPSQGYTPVHDLPAGSFIVTAPNGTQFYAPPGADFAAVYQYGSSLASMGTGIDFGLAWAHAFGGPFDFQRGNNQFNGNFSYAPNYAIGIDFAAAGQPLSYPLSLASLVKNTVAGGRGFQYAPQAIQQGYTAAQSGACGP